MRGIPAEVRTTQLPWSGLSVSYPTKYFKQVEGEGTTMRPDVYMPMNSGMLFEGENSILDAIHEIIGTEAF